MPELAAPAGNFEPGHYRVIVSVDNKTMDTWIHIVDKPQSISGRSHAAPISPHRDGRARWAGSGSINKEPTMNHNRLYFLDRDPHPRLCLLIFYHTGMYYVSWDWL
jgi:hypothetical protein